MKKFDNVDIKEIGLLVTESEFANAGAVFMRGYSIIQYPEAALKKNADYIIELAEAEGMKAHALAVKVRK